jgi:hypothetical protein
MLLPAGSHLSSHLGDLDLIKLGQLGSIEVAPLHLIATGLGQDIYHKVALLIKPPQFQAAAGTQAQLRWRSRSSEDIDAGDDDGFQAQVIEKLAHRLRLAAIPLKQLVDGPAHLLQNGLNATVVQGHHLLAVGDQAQTHRLYGQALAQQLGMLQPSHPQNAKATRG